MKGNLDVDASGFRVWSFDFGKRLKAGRTLNPES